ncbi:hypothetical protein Taro_055769 [Colocasia esculenta]|uniref:Uncharacterized protein n=1 Tax=Colocasia esculenta TaxID=4460 RepID=A0A843XU98_COLES|nr:hypothetical protein [Colocasia esculenta]
MVGMACEMGFRLRRGFSRPPGSVDTSPRFQKTQFPDWDSVSTQSQAVSTLDPVPRRPILRKWDNVSTHSLVVSTQST